MFAVREEVDVLKEKIVELLDRIQVLEHENSMLRNYVPADILSTLSLSPQSHQQQVHQAQQAANAATAAAIAAQSTAVSLAFTARQAANTPNLTPGNAETLAGSNNANVQTLVNDVIQMVTVATQNSMAEPWACVGEQNFQLLMWDKFYRRECSNQKKRSDTSINIRWLQSTCKDIVFNKNAFNMDDYTGNDGGGVVGKIFSVPFQIVESHIIWVIINHWR